MAWKDHFVFNKRQRNGIMVLIALIAVAFVFLIITDFLPPSRAVDFSSFKSEMAKVKFKPSDTLKRTIAKDTTQRQSKTAPTSSIELNSADSADFAMFPLVSPKVARTIVRFRYALGGYYSKKQLLEVYGMDTACYNSMLNKLTLDVSKVDKLDLNKTTEKELSRHPYIHKKLAKAIFDYRKQNGGFKDIKDLLNVEGVDEDLYLKLSPYLTISK